MARKCKIDVSREQVQAARDIKKVSGNQRKRNIVKLAEIIRIYGMEPSFHNLTPSLPNYSSEYRQGMNWANAAFDNSELKDYYLDHSKNNGTYCKEYETLPDYRFITLGKLAWAISRGLVMSNTTQEFYNEKVSELNNKINSPVIEQEYFEPKNSKREIDCISYRTIFAKIDQIVFKGCLIREQDFINILNIHRPSKDILNLLNEHYKENIVGANEEISNLKGKQIKVRNYLTNMASGSLSVVNAIDFYIKKNTVSEKDNNIEVKIRKVRVSKPVDPKKVVKNLKFKIEDTNLSLKSVKPESIIGTSFLIVFNTKTRKIGMFVGAQGGLQIKGSSITNYDEKASQQKILRNPETTLAMFMTGNVKKYENGFGDIKAVATPLNGRISDEILLLRIFK